jgi:putative flippase GtrA
VPKPKTAGQIARFVVAGAANTLLTGALLSLLALWIDQRVAYTIVFVLGIALSVFLTGTFVFRSRFTRGRLIAYVAAYLGIYLAGLGVTAAMVHFGLPPAWAGLVVVVTAPLGFLAGRVIFGDD